MLHSQLAHLQEVVLAPSVVRMRASSGMQAQVLLFSFQQLPCWHTTLCGFWTKSITLAWGASYNPVPELMQVWGKTGSKLYGASSGADYVDNPRRFRIFCEACIEACRTLPFGTGAPQYASSGCALAMHAAKSRLRLLQHCCQIIAAASKNLSDLLGVIVPRSRGVQPCRVACPPASRAGEDTLFVSNDWHSAMVPVLIKYKYKPQGQFQRAKCVFTVHNIAFQGRFWPESMQDLAVRALLCLHACTSARCCALAYA